MRNDIGECDFVIGDSDAFWGFCPFPLKYNHLIMRHVEAAPQASPLLCAQALIVCLPWLGKSTAENHAINSARYIAKRFWNAWRPY
jgi:hypothetical protein